MKYLQDRNKLETGLTSDGTLPWMECVQGICKDKIRTMRGGGI